MDSPENLLSHLVELRQRLMRILIAVGIAFLALLPWSGELYALLARPLLAALPAGGQMIATEVTTPFFVPMKVTLLAALLLALPYVLHQIWGFVAPGLYAHEKRLVGPLVVASTVLFFCGMAFAYFLVFPVVFRFVTGIAPQGVAVMTDIGKYLDFVLTLFVAFGVTFEVPIAVILLARMGVVNVATLRESRPYVIVGAFVIGAILTPPDVISQIMLALPLWLLYEAGVLVAAALERRTARPEAAED